jgi:hypothetical protein
MRILRSIVAPSAALMAFCESEMAGCGGIRSQLICDELVWLKAKAVCPISVKYISLDFFGLVRTQIGLTPVQAARKLAPLPVVVANLFKRSRVWPMPVGRPHAEFVNSGQKVLTACRLHSSLQRAWLGSGRLSNHWNEAENRFQFVDRLLTECLGWERPNMRVEVLDELGGKSDYVLGQPANAVLEAKREAKRESMPS